MAALVPHGYDVGMPILIDDKELEMMLTKLGARQPIPVEEKTTVAKAILWAAVLVSDANPLKWSSELAKLRKSGRPYKDSDKAAPEG